MWTPLNQITLTSDWLYTDPIEGELFKIRHSNLGSVARAMICQATIIDDELFLFQIREISANQNEIIKIEKPAAFENRRIGFQQIYGELDWTIQIEEFIMPNGTTGTGSASQVSYSSCTNTKVSIAANAPVQILAATPEVGDGAREYALLTNNSAVDITISYGDEGSAVLEQGTIIKGPGGFHEIHQLNLYRGEISAVAPGACSLSVIQCVK